MKKNILLIISILGACFQANAFGFNQNATQCLNTWLNNTNQLTLFNNLSSPKICGSVTNTLLNSNLMGGSQPINDFAVTKQILFNPACKNQLISLYKQSGCPENIIQF